MKRGVIWIALTCLMIASIVLTSCSTSTTTSTTTSGTSKTTAIAISTSVTTANPTTATSSVATTQSTSKTVTTGNWWDSLGKPQYGGQITLRMNKNISEFDPYNGEALSTIENAWLERLFSDDWTLNPSVFSYSLQFRPNDYIVGHLAQSWEFTDPSTLTVHLRQGVHWQNIPPVNGREFIANDVVSHYHRLYGAGGGSPDPAYAGVASFKSLLSVIAPDKYTVTFKWSVTNPEYIFEAIEAQTGCGQDFEATEAVQQWGDVTDWHHAIGTGPFMLTDFVSSSSATLVKNPNYWGYDERYPPNQLPYIDKLTFLIIPDDATALAGLRTGKIDGIGGMSYQQSQEIQKSNPEILQVTTPNGTAITVDPRNDVKPFTDIRVREALQMAIDLPTIAKTYYGGTVAPSPSTLTSNYMTGWGFPYDQWPQDLKDQYAYNPTKAKQLLSDAGYPNGFNTDIVADLAGDMDLLQIVKSYFNAINVNMDIRTMDTASWTAYVQLGHKHDQMAQRGNSSLGINYEPLVELNKFHAGGTSDFAMVNDSTFNDFLTQAQATTTLADFKAVFKTANERVAEQHFVISLLQPNVYTFYQPWLHGSAIQIGPMEGTLGSPMQICFYAARSWIDQNLKKSSGH